METMSGPVRSRFARAVVIVLACLLPGCALLPHESPDPIPIDEVRTITINVWGQDGFVEPRTVDVHVARLRAKFTAARTPMPAIETVRGVGYRFRDSARGDS